MLMISGTAFWGFTSSICHFITEEAECIVFHCLGNYLFLKIFGKYSWCNKKSGLDYIQYLKQYMTLSNKHLKTTLNISCWFNCPCLLFLLIFKSSNKAYLTFTIRHVVAHFYHKILKADWFFRFTFNLTVPFNQKLFHVVKERQRERKF